MSKAVLISIKPEWCEKIANGRKTMEIRKTRPKIQTPFKCYIYCTTNELLTKSYHNGKIYAASNKLYKERLEKNGNLTLSGKIIGEFVCDRIHKTYEPAGGLVDVIDCKQSCLTAREIVSYAGEEALYFWYISELYIYNKPKELSEFYRRERVPHGAICAEDTFLAPIYTPPQSWCYVEEL